MLSEPTPGLRAGDRIARPVSPGMLATAETWVALCEEVAATPVVSRAGGTHWHIVFPFQADDEVANNWPFCRRAHRRKKRLAQGSGPGTHKKWSEATLEQIATMPVCRECRKRLGRTLTWG